MYFPLKLSLLYFVFHHENRSRSHISLSYITFSCKFLVSMSRYTYISKTPRIINQALLSNLSHFIFLQILIIINWYFFLLILKIRLLKERRRKKRRIEKDDDANYITSIYSKLLKKNNTHLISTYASHFLVRSKLGTDWYKYT